MIRMNVFFDLECANCSMHIAKICEFGYVITDDNLNIVKSANMLIDPRSTFNVYGFKKGGITLAYDAKTYRNSPPLRYYYERIKELLTTPGNRVFGYSTEYDADYIRTDFMRSNLDPINFRFIDVMKLFRDYLGRSSGLALDVIYSEIDGAETLTHHEAKSDALMTVACFRHFLSLSGMTFKEAVTKCPLAYGELYEGRVVKDGTVFPYTKGNRMSQTNLNYLKQFVESAKEVQPIKSIEGRTFCIEKDYVRSHFAEVLFLSDRIAKAGGKITNVLSRANYIIVGDKDKKIPKARRQKLIALQDFCAMLGVSPRMLDEKKIDVDYLLSRIPENTAWYEKYIRHAHK